MKKVEKTLLLDKPGIILALALGLFILFFGGVSHFILLLVFFILSVVVTKYGYYEKKDLGIYEHERSWENVVANGLGPALGIIISIVFNVGVGPYIGAIAAVTSDKFASETGALAGRPIDLSTLKHVKPGKSGCVTWFGTLMSFTGALLIGIAAALLFKISPTQIVIIGSIGFIGSMIDTLFGVFEEKGIGNKTTTNIICSIVGIILGYSLLSHL
ncbi:DUF92 domain-containing protein [Candidatus Micrarchaeota archaeon]|nr:DUF92 domain-containing protein [Candidatus Micrarchaeota archaeon]